jgi:hypothetical protein
MRAFTVRAALALAILGGFLEPVTAAAAACANLPPSTLNIYDIKMPALEEVEVPAAALDRIHPGTALGSRHTLMFTTAAVVTVFEIQHHLVPQANGSVCDAPSLVRIGFGAGRRVAYMARAAAANSCVRQRMLAHEEDHNRRFNATVDRFIAQQNQDLQNAVTALKQMQAPGAAVAKARWETGLRSLLASQTRQLQSQIRADNAALDDGPTLAALADACGGTIRRLLGTDGL